MNIFRRQLIKSVNTTRAVGKLRVAMGLDRCGNQDGVLNETPDWSFMDGTPGINGKRTAKRLRRKKALERRIIELAMLADDMANKGQLPTVPGTKRHRRRDVAFFYEETPELLAEAEAYWKELEEKGKIIT